MATASADSIAGLASDSSIGAWAHIVRDERDRITSLLEGVTDAHTIASIARSIPANPFADMNRRIGLLSFDSGLSQLAQASAELPISETARTVHEFMKSSVAPDPALFRSMSGIGELASMTRSIATEASSWAALARTYADFGNYSSVHELLTKMPAWAGDVSRLAELMRPSPHLQSFLSTTEAMSNKWSELMGRSLAAENLYRDTLSVGGAFNPLSFAKEHLWSSESTARAFADLGVIGAALKSTAFADFGASAALRASLGDWRGIGDDRWQKLANAPLADRRALYFSNGLDPTLGQFPTTIYPDVLRAVDIWQPSGGQDEGTNSNDETRNSASPNVGDGSAADIVAFQALRSFERYFRAYLIEAMERAFGPSWLQRRISATMLHKWMKRRTTAIARGERESPPIYYADISDYCEIIVHSGNWAEYFSDIFQDIEEVNICFRRLATVRVPLMHAREIGNEDALMVHVEIARIKRAIRRNQSPN